MSQQDLIIYGTLLTVSVLAGLIILWGINTRRKHDADSLELNAARVAELTRAERLDDRFLWAIWQDRLSHTDFKLHVRDQSDNELTVVTLFHIPRGDVKTEYSLNGHRRQLVRESLMSNRTLLRDPATGRVLSACVHEMRQERFMGPDLSTERFQLRNLSFKDETRALVIGDEVIGKLFLVKKLGYHVRVLSVKPGLLTLEEQLFVLAGIRNT